MEPLGIPPESLELDEAVVVGATGAPSNQATANRAKAVLVDASREYRDVTALERSALAQAFAAEGFVVYGKAFDLVRAAPDLDLTDVSVIRAAIPQRRIVLIEVKATSLAARDEEFRGHFFSISTAELLVAQSLREHFRFVFVHTGTANFREVTLHQIYARATAIYPTWSIRLDSGSFEATTTPTT